MKKERNIPEINTSALPDIIFMLLFFFMTITVIRSHEKKITLELPEVESLQKLEYTKGFGNLYMGAESSHIQMNDKFIQLDEIPAAISQAKAQSETGKYMTKLYIDSDTKMKHVSDVKLEIRKSRALKIQYVLDHKNQ